MPKRILILTGRDLFADEWHDTRVTSEEISAALTGISLYGDGVEVIVRETTPDSLDDLEQFDLLVLNLSRPASGNSPDAAAVALMDRIASWARADGRIVALHQTALAAEVYPELAAVIGGHWVEGVSGHPPISKLNVRLVDNRGTVRTFDEQYQGLKVSPDAFPIGFADGSTEPAIWFYMAHGGRSIYDSLGHDARSFTPSHKELLRGFASRILTE